MEEGPADRSAGLFLLRSNASRSWREKVASRYWWTLDNYETISLMSRRTLERFRTAQEHWPRLSNLMACHFNQDFDILYGSLEGAIAAASRDGPLEHRRAILSEWRNWNIVEGVVNDIRPFLHDGFLVALLFETPAAARNFMNQIYDRLLVEVKAETR